MPFMKGPAPIRLTLKYLQSGRLVFKERVKIMTLNYNAYGEHHRGLRDFVFWHLPKVQYKNPDVQVVTLRNMTPSPFIRFFLDKNEEVLVDVDSKNKDEIYSYLIEILGKSKKVLEEEAKAKEQERNPAYFGSGYDRHCMCEVPGQVPCPAVIQLPNYMRGKILYNAAGD
ncbi:28S ribosomal protein S25, mitochondrial [Chamberlinius hualienensis]